MGDLLIFLGGILIIFGLIINFIPKFHLPLLPGDIFVQKDNFIFYFPIVTSIILSIIITIIFNIFR